MPESITTYTVLQCDEEINQKNVSLLASADRIEDAKSRKIVQELHLANCQSHRVIYTAKLFKGRKIGRMIPSSPSATLTSRRVRGFLFDNTCIDIDMENSNMRIIESLCKQNGLQCPVLSAFNARRKHFFFFFFFFFLLCKDFKVNRDEAKELFSSLPFGGSYAVWCEKYKIYDKEPCYVSSVKDELRVITKKLLDLPENRIFREFAESSGKAKNVEGSAFAHYVYTNELEIITTCGQSLKNKGYAVNAYLHDGLYIKSNAELITTDLFTDNLLGM